MASYFDEKKNVFFKRFFLGLRSMGLNEHIKLVQQKKEEAEILRLQKFQEQLRKKEQKW
jgi:hypothetical protein